MIRAEASGFVVHRLVQEVTRRSLIGERQGESLYEALTWVLVAFGTGKADIDDPRLWPYLNRLAPHASKIVSFAVPDERETAGYFVVLCTNLGALFQKQGDYLNAITLIEKALLVGEALLDPNDGTIAQVLNFRGDLKEAIAELAPGSGLTDFERALDICEITHGSDHPDTALSLHNVGFSLQMLGRKAEALPFVKRSLDIRERKLGSMHPHTRVTRNLLALLYADRGELKEAQTLLETDLRGEDVDWNHPATAQTLSTLAALYDQTGDTKRAKRFREQAIKIAKDSLGADHPFVRNLEDPERFIRSVESRPRN